MAYYVISYDLHKQRTYPPVWALLESWGAVRLLESLWGVTMNTGAGEIRAALDKVVDADDSTAVIELIECVSFRPLCFGWFGFDLAKVSLLRNILHRLGADFARAT